MPARTGRPLVVPTALLVHTALLLAGTLASGALVLVHWTPLLAGICGMVTGVVALATTLRRRESPRPARLGRGTWVAAVLVWLALVGGWAPATQEGFATASTLSFTGFAVASAAGYFRQGASSLPLRLLDFFLFQAAVVPVGIDGGLRLYAEWRPTPLHLPALASARAQLEAYRFRPGQVRFGFPCNSLGFYDDEVPAVDDPRPWIAVVGDSFVASPVPQPLHFTTVAEERTGEILQCFGVHGAGPREYRWLLEHEVLPRRPHAVLLSIFVSNDVTDSARADPSWFLRIFHPNDAPLFFLSRRRAQLARELRSTGAPEAVGHFEGDQIVIETEHGALRGTRQQLREALPSIAPWFFDRSLEQGVFSPEEYLRLESELASQVCAERSRCWNSFEHAMEEILVTVGEVPLGVLLLPDEFQVDDESWSRIVEDRGPLDRDLPQRRIREWLEANGIPVLDVLEPLRVATREEGPLYLLRDTHLGVRGNEVVGRELATFLEGWSPAAYTDFGERRATGTRSRNR